MIFGKKSITSSNKSESSHRLSDFAYLDADSIYADSACQSLRPQPVIDALNEYYQTYNACGGRVKYEWGNKVDQAVSETRQAVLDLLKLSARNYAVSFTLNTTYGLNLLLQQLPSGKFSKIITSNIEHNSVFLPTMTAAKRLDLPRLVLNRRQDGALDYQQADLTNAVVVINAVSNIDGRKLTNIKQLISDAHEAGGIVIIDAAQAVAHHADLLHNIEADAICFSAHKMYSASLGVVVANKGLLSLIEADYVGGGMVSHVSKDGFELVASEPESKLEPGLQAFGEIIALGAAIKWLNKVKPAGQNKSEYIGGLSQQLFDGLKKMKGLTLINNQASPVISFYTDKYDAHRLAVFLSTAGIMARSGYFCCHYYLKEESALPPLLRLSIGLHNTPEDINKIIETLNKLIGKA